MISELRTLFRGAIKNINSRITFALVFAAILIVGAAPIGLGRKGPAPAQQNAGQQNVGKKARIYYCVMDPEMKSNKPGACPKCGMRLRLASDEAPGNSDAKKNANNNDPDAIKDYVRNPDSLV